MRSSLAIAVFLFFAEQAGLVQCLRHILPPSDLIDVSKAFGHSNSAGGEVRRDAHTLLHPTLYQRNPIPSPSPDAIAQIITDSSPSLAASAEDTWNTTTEAACLKALETMNGRGANPCGMTACYNIRYLNTTTGAFQTELRLYRTSPATGDWASVVSKSYSIGLKCDGAYIAASNTKMGKRDDELLSWPPVRRYAAANKYFTRSTIPPQLLQQIGFQGQVNENLMGNINDGSKVRSYLRPTIAVSGKANNGKSLTADLSTNDMSFVTGILASQVTALAASGSSPASTSTSPAVTNAPAKITSFVLPGKTLGIFPVGLVITSVWAFLFLATVGLGTVDRIRFRDAYRRRMKREMGKGIARI